MATPGPISMKPVGKRQRQRQVARVVRETIRQCQFVSSSEEQSQHDSVNNQLQAAAANNSMLQQSSSCIQINKTVEGDKNIDVTGCHSLQPDSLLTAVDSSDEDVTLGDCESDGGTSDGGFCPQCRSYDCSCKDDLLQSRLRSWAVKHRITQTAVSDLLVVLKPNHPLLPQDARTLLKIDKSQKIVQSCGGEYLHFPLLKQLCKTIDRGLQSETVNLNTITLTFNVDGLPLFKSSSRQFWPILCIVKESVKAVPFPVGIFCGTSKPNSVDEFLRPLIDELGIIRNGFNHGGINYNVVIGPFVCDAPARAFVKCIKGHSGYFGCERCEQEGEYVNSRVTFPDIASKLRTDAEFLCLNDNGHHLAQSPLTALQFPMVTGFPLDYMHLVCLGVMRKLVKSWLSGHLSVRLSSRSTQLISTRLENLRSYIPTEFSRRPRTLHEVDRWKATEWRQLLLYTGPVVFHGIISERAYKHFLLLHVALYCLTSWKLAATHCEYAGDLLKNFVEEFSDMYGPEGLVYNVHNLVHLADDCRVYGALDNISAFPFENYLKTIKNMLRSGNSPLQQLQCRFLELDNLTCEDSEQRTRRTVKFVCTNGHDFNLSTSKRDCNVLLNNGMLVACSELYSDNSGLLMSFDGMAYKSMRALYAYPCNSDILDIYVVDRLSTKIKRWRSSDIRAKCMLLPFGREFVCIAMQHTAI